MLRGYREPDGAWRGRTRISSTVFFNHKSNISIGDNVFVGHYSILDGTGGLVIQEGVQFAGWNGIYTHSSHIAVRLYGAHYLDVHEEEKQGYVIKPVHISKYAFLGAHAVVLPGVQIGPGALIAAGTIVKCDVEPFDIVAGNPLKRIGSTKDMDSEFLGDRKIAEWYREWQEN